MSQSLQVQGDMHVNGHLSSRTLAVPAGTITDQSVSSSAGIQESKLQHRHVLSYTQPNGTAIVADTRGLWVCRGEVGRVLAIEAILTGAVATGGDRTVTIDLLKGNQASAYASILNAVLSFNSGSALRQRITQVILTPDLVALDSLLLEIAVAGAAGAQAQGLLVNVTVRESAQ